MHQASLASRPCHGCQADLERPLDHEAQVGHHVLFRQMVPAVQGDLVCQAGMAVQADQEALHPPQDLWALACLDSLVHGFYQVTLAPPLVLVVLECLRVAESLEAQSRQLGQAALVWMGILANLAFPAALASQAHLAYPSQMESLAILSDRQAHLGLVNQVGQRARDGRQTHYGQAYPADLEVLDDLVPLARRLYRGFLEGLLLQVFLGQMEDRAGLGDWGLVGLLAALVAPEVVVHQAALVNQAGRRLSSAFCSDTVGLNFQRRRLPLSSDWKIVGRQRLLCHFRQKDSHYSTCRQSFREVRNCRQ